MPINETVIIPIIVAVVELMKGLGVPKKFAALASVVLGGLIGVFYLAQGDFKTGLLKGIIYGLSASGLYSGTKNTFQQMVSPRRKK